MLVSVIDLEARFGLARSWWYSMAESGRVPSYRLRKYRRFKLSEVAAWLEQQRCGPTAVASNGTAGAVPAAPDPPATPRPLPRGKGRRARSTRR
jgi:excisionase family DNA binding protein